MLARSSLAARRGACLAGHRRRLRPVNRSAVRAVRRGSTSAAEPWAPVRVLRCTDAERVLDGGERLFRRVFGFLRNIRHFGRRLVITPDYRRGPNRHNQAGRATSVGPLAAAQRRKRRPIYRPAVHPIVLAMRKKPRW